MNCLHLHVMQYKITVLWTLGWVVAADRNPPPPALSGSGLFRLVAMLTGSIKRSISSRFFSARPDLLIQT